MAARTASIPTVFAASLALVATLTGCGSDAPPSDLPPLPEVAAEQATPAAGSALSTALALVQSEPLNPMANGELGMALATSGQTAAAAVSFERARQLAPDDYRWAYLHGLILEELGDPSAAAAAVANAVHLNDRYIPARAKLAMLRLDTGNAERTGALLGPLLLRHGDRADVHLAAGRYSETVGKLDEARRHYERALELNGPFAAAHTALASVYTQQKRPELAAEQRALAETYHDRKLRIDNPLLADQQSEGSADQQHIERAKALVRDGDFEGAASALAAAIEANPQQVESVATLILIYRRLDRLDDAEKAYKAAMLRGVDGVDMHLNMGNFYFDKDRAGDAKDAFAKVLQIDSLNTVALTRVGFIAERAGRMERAELLYRRAIESDTNNKQARYQLGQLLAAGGDYAGGIEQFEAVLTTDDANTPYVLHALAGLYARSGDVDKGIDLLDQASDVLASRGSAGTTALRDKIEADRRQFIQQRDSGAANP